MQKIKFYGMMLFMILSALSLSSCSNDDDDDILIDSYLKGKWHSYKVMVSAQNITTDLDITKYNQYSQFYYETFFKDNNIVDFSYYNLENNISSRWITETYTYSVKDDVVTIYDSNDAIDFIYNSKEKNMYMRLSFYDKDNVWTTLFVYFCK